jgi:hypothetical protein
MTTVAHTGQVAQDCGQDAAGTAAAPVDLDLKRQLREAREELRALRERNEALACDLATAQDLYAELHVAYVELLAHARAAVAAAARGEVAPVFYVAGHLEEIGLEPAPGAAPDAVVAEGLAVADRLQGGGAAS